MLLSSPWNSLKWASECDSNWQHHFRGGTSTGGPQFMPTANSRKTVPKDSEITAAQWLFHLSSQLQLGSDRSATSFNCFKLEITSSFSLYPQPSLGKLGCSIPSSRSRRSLCLLHGLIEADQATLLSSFESTFSRLPSTPSLPGPDRSIRDRSVFQKASRSGRPYSQQRIPRQHIMIIQTSGEALLHTDSDWPTFHNSRPLRVIQANERGGSLNGLLRDTSPGK